MKIMTKLNLLSLVVVLVMTGAILAVGAVIIDAMLYRFEERILQLELATAEQAIIQKLNRSGVRAAAQTAVDLQTRLQQKQGLRTAKLYIVEGLDNRIIFHPDLTAGAKASFEFIDRMFGMETGAIAYEFGDAAHFAVFTTIRPINWLIGISIAKDEMLATKFDFLRAIGGTTLLILGLNAVVIGVFGRRLLQRIGAVLDCVKRIERGELSARVSDFMIEDEIGHLQHGVNAMGARIEQRTAQQQDAETALRESRERLQSIIDNSAAVIFVKDLEGRYLLINRRFAELFHIGQDAIVGRTDGDIFSPEQAAAYRNADRQVLATGTAQQVEEVASQDDRLHTYLSLKYPLNDESGRPYAVCGIATDITERKQAEAERQARRTAEAANRAKTEFLAHMSHELRTPLNAILGYAQLLKRSSSLSGREAAGVATIQQSGTHLLTLINDLLDLAKIEANKLDLCPAEIDLVAGLRVVADIVRVKAEEKSLLFVHETSAALPQAVRADEKRLRQVLLNLLGNAVKFTDRGRVSLRVQSLAGDADWARLRFEVVDTGVGVAADQLDKIFLPFEQVGEGQRRAAGTGLGLAISCRLVSLMGGEIKVESTLGQGSRFWFDLTLPVVAAPAAQAVERMPTGYHGPRRTVLIADDVPANRAMLADLLGGLGFKTCEAVNGREAVEQTLAGRPDLVLMDLVMPVVGGIEAIRRIRAKPGLVQLPVIAVSANASREDQAESLTAGADAFLSKPIEPDVLLNHIGVGLGLQWIYAETEPAPEPATDEPEALRAIPPRPELDRLHDLALIGDMRAIREQAAHLIDLDVRYRPFADRLDRLAGGYQSKAVLGMIETHLAVEETP